MKAKEIKEKSDRELNNLIRDSKEKLKNLRFKMANRQLKNVKEVSETKKTIARAKTFLAQRIEEK